MTFDLWTVLAILTMAAITYATRVGGIFLAERLVLSGRAKAALNAIPAAVLTAVIAPMALATGPAETIAAICAAIAAVRLPLLAVVGIGVAAIVGLRQLGL